MVAAAALLFDVHQTQFFLLFYYTSTSIICLFQKRKNFFFYSSGYAISRGPEFCSALVEFAKYETLLMRVIFDCGLLLLH